MFKDTLSGDDDCVFFSELTEVKEQLSKSQMSCEQLEAQCKKLRSRNEQLEVVEEEKVTFKLFYFLF